MNLEFSDCEFASWRENSSRMWPWIADPLWVPINNNPYGMLQYYGRELSEKILYFPVCAKVDNKEVAWALTYNVSDTHVRIRGLYVSPDYRGQGIGVRLCDYAVSRWPSPWKRCVGYWSEEAFTKLSRHWGLRRIDDVHPRGRVTGDGKKFKEQQLILGFKDFR